MDELSERDRMRLQRCFYGGYRATWGALPRTSLGWIGFVQMATEYVRARGWA